ncbi:hypothetical protein D0X99_05530 [Algoriphagus lacus]|uniref:NnrS family protein n=1 Tax=Algoriphagus lacus TaxID=2056311 RepID=A0A418PUG8_9BACT|nr:hypothetical protein [Algoriphagus lacus]RIW17212.1 hypothetical protein D0X99_05530 [Algoriphagus lacus]
MKFLKPSFVLPLVVLGLVLGVAGGWIRLGYPVIPITEAGVNHGLLMVGGFLGTLISIERAMVMKKKFWLLIPILSGLSNIFFLIGEASAGLLFLLSGSLGLGLIIHYQSVKDPNFHTFLLYCGAVFWFIGNFMVWKSGLIPAGSTWWMGFLIFTIVGERLELTQFLPVPSWSKKALGGYLGLFFIGMLFPFHGLGNELLGVAVLMISAWLLVFDMAKVASKKKGQFRYTGIGLRIGYLWMGIQGLILLLMESHPLFYDLVLHTFFLGFTFSMIWAHAPIIFPTFFGIRQSPYHNMLWWPWASFQLTLLGRIAFALVENWEWRIIMGVTNGFLIFLMFLSMAGILLWKLKSKKLQVKEAEQNQLFI